MLRYQLIIFAVLSLVILQLHQVKSDDSVNGCKANFTKVGDKCLLAVQKWSTWYIADRHCHSLGAGLYSFQNQIQLQQVEQWLNVSQPFKPRRAEFWTSGNSLGQTGVYYWQSTGELARFLTWYPGGPKPANGDCLTLYARAYKNEVYSDYLLVVRSCNYPQIFICEHEPQNYKYSERICLKPGSYETAKVLV